MPLKTRSSLNLAVAALSALAIAGCGGGELSGQASTAPTQPPATSPPPPAQTTTTPPTTAPPASTTTTPPATTQPPPQTTPTTTTPAPSTTPSTTATQPPPEDPPTPIEETAQLVLVEKISAIEYTQRGTVTGTFDGEMTLHAKVESRGIVVQFTVTVPGGTISGRGVASIRLTGAKLEPIQGTAIITGGTGEYADIRGRDLVVKGRAAVDGSRAVVRLSGSVRY